MRQAREGGLALIYRGPASEPGCPEAVAELVRASRWQLEVEFVGPRERRDLGSEVLREAVLYAQPGGGELGRAYRRLRRHAPAVREFVGAGGRYLGFCLGGYLAGRTPGFGILPGDTDQYIASPGASIAGEEETVATVRWRGRQRRLYFQDGPCFELDADAMRTQIVAVYDNGLPAALVAPYHRGAVAVSGPHPEATPDWFADAGLPRPWPRADDLALDLLDELMRA